MKVNFKIILNIMIIISLYIIKAETMIIIGQQHFKKHARQASAKQAVFYAKIATRWNYFIHISISE